MLAPKSVPYSEILIQGSIRSTCSKFQPPPPPPLSPNIPVSPRHHPKIYRNDNVIPASEPASPTQRMVSGYRGDVNMAVFKYFISTRCASFRRGKLRCTTNIKRKVITLICFIHYNKPKSGWQNVFFLWNYRAKFES